MNKYRNKKICIDGIMFDSHAEGRRYQDLKLMEKAGLIRDLTLQPKFVLLNSFKHEGKTIRAVKYIADFMYVEGSITIIEDVKGMETDVFKLKEKLFLFLYPDYVFRKIK